MPRLRSQPRSVLVLGTAVALVSCPAPSNDAFEPIVGCGDGVVEGIEAYDGETALIGAIRQDSGE